MLSVIHYVTGSLIRLWLCTKEHYVKRNKSERNNNGVVNHEQAEKHSM